MNDENLTSLLAMPLPAIEGGDFTSQVLLLVLDLRRRRERLEDALWTASAAAFLGLLAASHAGAVVAEALPRIATNQGFAAAAAVTIVSLMFARFAVE